MLRVLLRNVPLLRDNLLECVLQREAWVLREEKMRLLPHFKAMRGRLIILVAIVVAANIGVASADTIIKNDDGSSVETKSDGTETITNKDGSSVEKKPNGTVIVKNADGSSEEKRKDGTDIVINPDKSSVADLPDGTEIIKNADGSSEQDNPDGSKLIINADGSRVVEKAKKK
jgi:hypothetical protein